MRLPVGPSPGWELEDRDNDTPNGGSSSPLHSVADRYVHLSSDAYHELNHLIATVLSSYNPSDNVDICLAYPLKSVSDTPIQHAIYGLLQTFPNSLPKLEVADRRMSSLLLTQPEFARGLT